jgi:regulator of sigma E protease|tara:strand:+ start:4839 stop:5909 length:1071 start_codon:yes stop_codon:yes gene_type:complete
MIYIIAFIILISVIVFVHELGHYLAARSVGVTVEQFSIGMPPTIYKYKPKNINTVFVIGALPLGGYVKIKGMLDENMDTEIKGADDELESKSALQKIWVLSAGVIMNIILAFFVFSAIGALDGDAVPANQDAVIDFVAPGGPAEDANLLVGDKIISINNIEVTNWKTAVSIVEKNPNQEIPITIMRDGESYQQNIKLSSGPNFKAGRVDQTIGLIGIAKDMQVKELSLVESFQYGYNRTAWSMVLMSSSLKMIFQGNVSKDEVGSVIMIGQMAGDAAQAGLSPFLLLMALISVNLAFINMLPIPGLDGGHIAVILIEVLMRRKLSVKARMRIQSVGMFILLSLMAFLLINDVLRLF